MRSSVLGIFPSEDKRLQGWGWEMQVDLPSALCLCLKQEGLSLTHKWHRYQGSEMSDDASVSGCVIMEDGEGGLPRS